MSVGSSRPLARWALARWAPALAVAAFAALWTSRWESFPIGPDPAYHLAIARQVVAAGGPIGYEWWEAAPEGRPHLYPPTLHLLLAGLLKAGVDPLACLRLLSAALPVAWLLALFLAASRLFGEAIGCCALWAGLLPFSAHLAAAMTMASTLACIELLWLMVAIEEGRAIAAGALVALLGYTHLGLPLIAGTAVVAYGIARPAVRPVIGRAAWGMALIGPWWWHLWRHQDWLRLVGREENAWIQFLPFLYMLAAAGLWTCLRRRGRWLWLPACLAGFLWLAPYHRYRWLSGEGVMPVVLLAAVGLDRLAGRRRRRGMAVAALWIALALLPSWTRTAEGWRWRWRDSAPWHVTGVSDDRASGIDVTLASAPLVRWANVVAARTRPDEILWSNAPYAGGLVAALAGRATSSAMLADVPARAADPISAAHAIWWAKIEELPRARRTWTPIAEDAIAAFFRQAGERPGAHPPAAACPLMLAWAGIAALIAAAAWDLARLRRTAGINTCYNVGLPP